MKPDEGGLREIGALAAELAESTQEVLGRVRDAREELAPPVDPLIAFVHIPKTAGGTATNMLSAAYSKQGVRPVGNYIKGSERTEEKVDRGPGGWESWQRSGGHVAVGHVPYTLFREHLPPGTRYMTFLREPVDRVLSHYYRHVHSPPQSFKDHIKPELKRGRASSLEQALAEMRLPQLSNLATRFLCGHPSPMGELSASAIDDAKANLREFAFVGIQERFEESLVLLQRMLGVGQLPYLNRHVSEEGSRPGVDDISGEERALILEHNRLDAELYAFGLDLFEEAVASAEPGLADEAARLRELSEGAIDQAERHAREWIERELPVGTEMSKTALFQGARAAGVDLRMLNHLLKPAAVRTRSGEDVVWLRTGEVLGSWPEEDAPAVIGGSSASEA